MEAAGGILLLASIIAALAWANSPRAESYHSIWNPHASIGFGMLAFKKTHHEWINDGLMAVLCFLVAWK